jgi:hypothetical protein
MNHAPCAVTPMDPEPIQVGDAFWQLPFEYPLNLEVRMPADSAGQQT